MFESILSFIAQLLQVTATSAATAAHHAGLKAMRVSWQPGAGKTGNGLAAYSHEAESSVNQHRAGILELTAADAAAPVRLESANRTLALAMLERGESPAVIVARLGVSRNEVELLMKIRRIIERQSC